MPKQRKRAKVVLLVTGILAVVVVGVVAWHELVAWRTFRRDFESLGRNEQGYPEYQHRETGIVFVSLPGGAFEMGSPETESARLSNEGPVHKVTLSPFFIAKYEVTQAEWKKVMGSNPSRLERDAFPVLTVSWEECQEFCKRVGFSLPTEAQWEYACRSGTAGPFAGTGRLDDMGWYTENSGTLVTPGAVGWPIHPVGEKLPNQFGLHDMHGNNYEWCVDVYDEHFFSTPKATQKNPVCTSSSDLEAMRPGDWRSGVFRVMRGGAWYSSAGGCRSAHRGQINPLGRFNSVAFRPVAPSP